MDGVRVRVREIHAAAREATAEFTDVPAEFWQAMDWAIDIANNNNNNSDKPLTSIPSFVTAVRSQKNSTNFGLWLKVALAAIKSHVSKCRITWTTATGCKEDAYKSLKIRNRQSFT
jgi:hypothetical protein